MTLGMRPIVVHHYAPGCDFVTLYLPIGGGPEIAVRHYHGSMPRCLR